MELDRPEILARLKQRDPDALALVFDSFANKIYRLALGILNDEQQADGVVQDTFLKLIKHIDSFEGKSKLGTWLYRIAYNEAQQRIRRAKPHLDFNHIAEDDLLPACLVDWQSIPESQLHGSEALQEMQEAVNKLSEALRAVFILRDVEEVSTQETATILNISESAVKVRLHRARLILREKLSTYFMEYDAT